MSRWRAVWLVAAREVTERGKSRGFVLSVAITTLFVVGGFFLPRLLASDPEAIRLGIVEPAPAGLVPALLATAREVELPGGLEIATYADARAAEQAIAAGAIGAALAVPADLSGPGELVLPDQRGVTVSPTAPIDGASLKQVIDAAVVGLRTVTLVTEAGIDPADLAEAQRPTTVRELRTEPDDAGVSDRGARFLLANITAVLILIGVFGFGFTVLTAVVEEKQSRVVEVVLATVRPRDLLVGKVLGIGILGLVQLAAFLVAGLAAASATSAFELPASTPDSVALLGIWFVLGYTLYATALGFLGALASRIEEASNATTPVTMLAIGGYLVSLFAVTDAPDGVVARVATFLPPLAPMVVPFRAAFDAIAPWEVALSIGVTAVAIYALFVVGGRIYAGAALQTVGRMRLRDAWRSASE